VSARLEWGCDCLEIVNLFFRDYPTELQAPKTLVPCLVQKLGVVSPDSSPPFDYHWRNLEDLGDLRLGPEDLSLIPQKGTTKEQGFLHLLQVLGACDARLTQAR
jgi:hypothetical protein